MTHSHTLGPAYISDNALPRKEGPAAVWIRSPDEKFDAGLLRYSCNHFNTNSTRRAERAHNQILSVLAVNIN